jgi:hypothetical protein
VNIHSRLAKLEDAADRLPPRSEPDPPVSPAEDLARRRVAAREWAAWFAEALDGIPEPLKALVSAAAEPDSPDTEADALLDALAKWPNIRCALAAEHPALAAVYLCNPHAAPYHDCEDCGIRIPIGGDGKFDHHGRPVPSGTKGIRHFLTCPACGGRTGWYAHHVKHGWTPRKDG